MGGAVCEVKLARDASTNSRGVNSERRAQRQVDFPAHNVVSRERIKTSSCVDVPGWKKRGILVEHVVHPGADLHMLGYAPVDRQIKVAVVRDMRQHRIKKTFLLILQRDLRGIIVEIDRAHIELFGW